MPKALWLLIGLRIKGVCRQLYRGLKTPKGIIIFFLFLAIIGVMMIPALLSFFTNRNTITPESQEQMLTFGPSYCWPTSSSP